MRIFALSAQHCSAADLRHRARVDSAVDWHHGNVRRGSALLVLNRVINPRLGRPLDKRAASDAEGQLTASLKVRSK